MDRMTTFDWMNRKRSEQGQNTNIIVSVDEPTGSNTRYRPVSASQAFQDFTENSQSYQDYNSHWLTIKQNVEQLSRQSLKMKELTEANESLFKRCFNKQKTSDSKIEDLKAAIKILREEIADREREMKIIQEEHCKTLDETKRNHHLVIEKNEKDLSTQAKKIRDLTITNDLRLTSLHNNQKLNNAKVKDLEAMVQKLQADVNDRELKMKKMQEEHCKTLEDTHANFHNNQKLNNAKVKDLEAMVQKLQADVNGRELKMKKMQEEHCKTLEDTHAKLNAMASAKLTEGNAKIADLSDENRPTKLAEKYSELYDNEWTDAYDLLTQNGETEEYACQILLRALCNAFVLIFVYILVIFLKTQSYNVDCVVYPDIYYVKTMVTLQSSVMFVCVITYIVCRDKADDDLETIGEAMRKFLGTKEPTARLMEPFKDQRKNNWQGHIKLLKKGITPHIKTLLPERGTRTDSRIKTFLKKSAELCWLMVVQEPPVFLDVNIHRSGEIYDSNILKPYTKSGNYIDFIVWPPIYLQEDGSILFKGIAQCKPDNNNTETALHPLEKTQNTEQPGNARTFQRK